jgi:hypothetical protein
LGRRRGLNTPGEDVVNETARVRVLPSLVKVGDLERVHEGCFINEEGEVREFRRSIGAHGKTNALVPHGTVFGEQEGVVDNVMQVLDQVVDGERATPRGALSSPVKFTVAVCDQVDSVAETSVGPLACLVCKGGTDGLLHIVLDFGML